MGQDYLDVEAADGINGGTTSHNASSRRSFDTNVPIFSINVEDCSTAPSIIPLTPPSHANVANDGPGFNCSESSSSAWAIDAGTTSNPTSWLSLLGGGGEHKGQSEQPRNIAALHAAVDDALSGRITANSGVSFCISRCSLQNPAVDSTKQQANPNVSSAVVQPAPDHQQEYCGHMITSAEITTHSEKQGMALTFVDVSYTLAKKRRRMYSRSWGSTRPGKRILNGITGCVMPGEMLALMGPSGSGKTTLLNLLGGRRHEAAGEDINIIKGEILYDGAPYSKTLKPRMGFVTQDDMLYPHLTVKETLTYAALLRLPASMSRQRKTHKADQILCQLGLQRCRDTIIGNAFLRGVSGGERKRVCIGHEIIIDPSLIFLDEPTSGLDSTTALRIMYLLQGLAKAGRSVVTTIHQPSSRAFYLFDKLLLLSEGHCVYFGKAHSAMQHFEACGFFPLVPMNPADFLLDMCTGNTFDIKVPTELLEEDGQVDSNEATFKIHVVQYLLECNAKEGAINNEIRGASLPLTFQEGEQKATRKEAKREWAVGWGAQVAILLERGLKERRHDYLGWLKVTQVMATALLCGALWWHSNPNSPIDLQDQVGLLFFIGIFWGFFPLFNAIFTFPLERTLLAKERSSDMYRLSAYFIARSLSDLPLDLLLPTGFLTMVYFMTTLRMSAMSFLLTMLAVYLTVITSQGVGLLVGAALLDIKKATTFGSVLVIALMLAAGFFVQVKISIFSFFNKSYNHDFKKSTLLSCPCIIMYILNDPSLLVVQNIPKWVAWIKYFSFQSYCYKLLLKIQYYPHYNIQICSSMGASSMPCKQAMSLNEALHGMQLEPGLEEVWSLLALSLVSRLLAYLALRRVRITTIGKKLQHCVCCNHSKQL